MENTTEKTVKTTKQKVWFGVRIALNVVFYAIILLVLLFSISNINAKNKKDRIPNIFGMGYLNVLTDSMDGDFDNSFKPGDMIIVRIANKDRIADLKVGDIVTFYDYNLQANTGASSALNTHRIVFISEKDTYYTVGDKALKLSNFDITKLNEENCNELLLQTFGYNGFQAFSASDIRGIYSSKWTGFGKVIKTVNDHFVPIVIVPIGALLLLEIGYLIYNIMKVREEKIKKTIQPQQDDVITDDDKEKLKAELRAQLLAEMGVSAEATAKTDEQPAEPQEEQVEEAPAQEEAEAAPEVTETEENAEEPVAPQEEPVVETPAQEEPEETQVEESVEPQEEPVQEAPAQEEPKAELEEAKAEEKEEKLEEAEEKKPVKKAPAKKATSAKKTTANKTTATAAKKPAATKAATTKASTTKATAKKPAATKASVTKAASPKTGTAKKTTTTAKKSTPAAKKPSTTKKTTAKNSK